MQRSPLKALKAVYSRLRSQILLTMPHYLDSSFCVHGDDVVGVPGQLIQGHGRPLMDPFIFGFEVAHKRSHGARIAKGRPVAATHGAEADGLRQISAEPLVSLREEAARTGR